MKRIALLLLAPFLATSAIAQPADPWVARGRAMLEHAINIPTVAGREKVPELANYLAGEFRKAGWAEADIHVIPYVGEGDNKTAALIMRWPAAGAPKGKPILLMGHMDVVEAKREDWTVDPFVFAEKDGYYYGRGTADIKGPTVAMLTALLKLKSQGFKPQRDLVVLLTGDEETAEVGAKLAATEWRKWTDAEYGLNADAGGGSFTADGRPLGFGLQTAEKTFADYTLTVRNKGGHSSRPRPDNAIYQLAHALDRIEAYRFEPALNETTRAYYQVRQQDEKGALGNAMRAWLKDPKDGKAADAIEADPLEVGSTRTRCVATLLSGGHADNALPQLATANINCRILPGVSPDAIRTELEAAIKDPGVVVTRRDDNATTAASPLRPDVVAAFTDAVHARFPASKIVPQMSAGATDGAKFRAVGIPIYGVDGAWIISPDDERAHGRDERLPVKAFADDIAHWDGMLSRLAAQ
ncbi:M20/M25/M40 family metallo-hydrolase [Sphingomonas sp. BIUV-7]|uniref:M20/M25/M40 family metallo-hydrolase n=1 Tax=Sphingomonas natans TaxID=3063330 RepID=A0ABT8YEX5_9SPHN|nr:M20/M25/M40 family metallo-hydrolase [Sphingomonas sp. BIUV-7]MDO6416926.1 M20/M25/M40 family metallo-hydrolase [Sphingomonas sp. BIUV-7]